jgi:hypothetical protein
MKRGSSSKEIHNILYLSKGDKYSETLRFTGILDFICYLFRKPDFFPSSVEGREESLRKS